MGIAHLFKALATVLVLTLAGIAMLAVMSILYMAAIMICMDGVYGIAWLFLR